MCYRLLYRTAAEGYTGNDDRWNIILLLFSNDTVLRNNNYKPRNMYIIILN